MKKFFHFDKTFFWITAALVVCGLLVFLSASFSVFSDSEKFKSILFTQLVMGLGGGIVLFLITLSIPLEFIKKYSLWFYGFGIILLGLVFIPHIGFSHGGATRWLSIGPLSFQPVEFAKYTTIIYVAAWLSTIKSRVTSISQGLIPFCIMIGIVGTMLLLQPDTDSFLVIAGSAMFVYFLAGAKWRDIGIMVLMAIVCSGGLLLTRPYLVDRVKVFFDPSADALGASYQVQQQLIAIGSGGATGRGFGQGIQKFKYLPEPLGDSIFSTIGEEFGFVGTVTIVLLYLMFFFRGMWIAARTKDPFGKLLIAGIISLIVLQSFLNIASAIAVFPLGGLPLIFISHGGTALAFAIGAVGLVLNISKGQSTSKK